MESWRFGVKSNEKVLSWNVLRQSEDKTDLILAQISMITEWVREQNSLTLMEAQKNVDRSDGGWLREFLKSGCSKADHTKRNNGIQKSETGGQKLMENELKDYPGKY